MSKSLTREEKVGNRLDRGDAFGAVLAGVTRDAADVEV